MHGISNTWTCKLDSSVSLHQEAASIGGLLVPGAGSGNGFQMSGSRCLPPHGYATVALISVIRDIQDRGGGGEEGDDMGVSLSQDVKTFL